MRFEMPPATDRTEGRAAAARAGRPPATAVFRCDADPASGAGHVYRCLSLAMRLAALGWRCTFAVGHQTVPALARAGFAVMPLPPGEEAELRALTAAPAELLVIDHYGRDARFESACRSAFGRILVLDDAPRPHDCDLLLDATPGRTPADYAGLVPAQAGLLCGPAFAALRPDFIEHRATALARRSGRLDRVLVSIGGSDAGGATALAAEAARRALPDARIDVVAGGAAPGLPGIRRAAAGIGGTLHVDTDAMAGLMAAADLAIGAPGGSSWERCALGLPALLFTVAANQRANAAALAAAGAAEDLGPPDAWSVERLADRIAALARDPHRLRAMGRAAAALTDGNGALRVAMALAGTAQAGDRAVVLRPAVAEDADAILDWQREPDARRFARNAAVPTDAEHAAWMAGRLAAADNVTAIVELAGRPAGLLRLDPHGDALEVSILIAAAAQGRGVGRAALALARRLAPGRDLWAEVLPGNDRSRALFRAAGYADADGNWLVAEAPR